jgi:hypothetical protein
VILFTDSLCSSLFNRSWHCAIVSLQNWVEGLRKRTSCKVGQSRGKNQIHDVIHSNTWPLGPFNQYHCKRDWESMSTKMYSLQYLLVYNLDLPTGIKPSVMFWNIQVTKVKQVSVYFDIHLSGCMKVPQIFYKFESQLQILGVKKVAWNKFHTGMTCKLHCYLVFLAQNICNDTHFYMYWKKLQDYIDSIRCHQSKWDLCNSGLHSSNSHGLGMCEGFLACSFE